MKSSAPIAPQPPAPAVAQNSPHPPRRWVFRIAAAFLAAFVPLAGFELALRLSGYGHPTGFFVPAPNLGPNLLIENRFFGHRFFPPRWARNPQPLKIQIPKPPNTLRIVVLGESAAMGDPEPAFGLPRQLETLLQSRFPERPIEVINAAMTAINSHAIREIAQDAAALHADAWILYLGNNEVMGPFGPGTVFGAASPSLASARFQLLARATRIGQFLHNARHASQSQSTNASKWGGMEMFLSQQIPATDPRLANVRNNFEQNLEAILQLAQNSSTPVLLSSVAVNLRDSAPFSTAHRPGLTQDEQQTITQHLDRAAQLDAAGNPSAARTELLAAATLDPDSAEIAYRLGRVTLKAGDPATARKHFVDAVEKDTLRFRTDPALNSILAKVAARHPQVHWVDIEKHLSSLAPDACPGAEFFWEHVHFNFTGNYRLAREFAEHLAKILPLAAAPTAPWLSEDQTRARLGYTPWHELRSIETLRQRLARPPFREQSNAADREAALRRHWESLRSKALGPAFEKHAATLRDALARRTNDWMLHDQFAHLLAGFQDVEGAVEQWETALRLMPHALAPRFELGKLLAARPQSATNAETHLRLALDLRPDFPEALNELGQALGQQKRFDESIAAFKKAIDLRPEYVEAKINAGLSLRAAHRTNDALVFLTDAVNTDTNHLAAQLHLARTFLQSGRFRESAHHYAQVVRLRPNNPAALFEYGDALLASGDPVLATRQYLATLQLQPDNVDARYRVALELARQGQHNDAVKQFTEVVRRRPDWVAGHLDLGVALLADQRPAEAVAAFDRALQIDPKNERARRYLDAVRSRTQP